MQDFKRQFGHILEGHGIGQCQSADRACYCLLLPSYYIIQSIPRLPIFLPFFPPRLVTIPIALRLPAGKVETSPLTLTLTRILILTLDVILTLTFN